MKEKLGPYHVIDLPPARRDTPNFLDLIQVKHSMYGLLEVDVTVARQFIEAHKARTGEALSFTGYLAFCLARAVDEDKSVQAYLKGRKQLVMFDDVDVGMTIERQIERDARPGGPRYSSRQPQDVPGDPPGDPLGTGPTGAAEQRDALLVPVHPVATVATAHALHRPAARHPARDPAGPAGIVATGGTVGVTAVGMFGHGSGWGLTPAAHSLMLVVGGIARKPAVVDDRIEPREILSLTVAFDHDVVDGAPAARFVRRLVELIESGYGLAEGQQAPHTDAGSEAELPSEIRMK